MIEKNELLQSIIEGIQEKKGKNISAIQLKGMSGAICDYFLICEGNSPTQVSALANSIEDVVWKNIQRSVFTFKASPCIVTKRLALTPMAHIFRALAG